jgi:hypothetical protein
MVSLRNITKGAVGKFVVPAASGMAIEYVMKTVAFSNNGLVLPRPAPNIFNRSVEWFGQPHIIAGTAMSVGLPLLARGRAKKASGAAARFQDIGLGYIFAKYTSENFGVTQSPFRTSPNSKPEIPELNLTNTLAGRDL